MPERTISEELRNVHGLKQHMETLAKPLRKQLEDAVVKARDAAENAAHGALMHLGIGDGEVPKHLTDDERALRRRLRGSG